MKTSLFVLFFIFLSTGFASAQATINSDGSGNALSAHCKGYDTIHEGIYNSGFCLGFIEGVSSLVEDCEGPNVTLGQEIKVVLKYMDDHPEQLDQNAATLVRRALMNAFPCKK